MSYETRPPPDEGEQAQALSRIIELQKVIKSLSTASSSQSLLRTSQLQWLLEQAKLSETSSISTEDGSTGNFYAQSLEWLLVSKAATQTYGIILNTLLEQTIPLSNDIWYWDEVLGSYAYSGLYTFQTSPLRFWVWSKDIYGDARARLDSLRSRSEGERALHRSLADRWRQFYGLVKDSIRDRSIADIQLKAMSPVTRCRAEARDKQKQLKRLRELSACGLGMLMDEALTLDTDDEGSVSSRDRSDTNEKAEWKSIVAKSVALMETVLRNVTTHETGISEFEEAVFVSIDEDPEMIHTEMEGSSSRPAILAGKLQEILAVHLPSHVAASNELARQYGKPSLITRYWLPSIILLLSSGTLLRIFFNRQAEILTWIRDLGVTTRDFWYNWVVEPIKKVIGTIRHDKDSEIAIMSKESLQGDRASLERMVVDFAVDNSSKPNGAPLSEVEIEQVRAKVREGDLTPVLKAYERDLRKPFMGTIRGDLVRALLIQVQKTKVDVEVAIGGIDALLKSQELVFGSVLCQSHYR